jgi:hypothetical protein
MARLSFVEKFIKEAKEQLEILAGRELTEKEYERLLYKIDNDQKDRKALIVNPHKQISQETTLGKLASWMDTRPNYLPIVTGHGTLFKPHTEFDSVLKDLLQFLLDARKVSKNQMFDLLKLGKSEDDNDVKALNLKQLIFKLLANSFYGALGEKGFIFFNDALGPAVTYTAQLIITATLFGFEAFLGSNLWLRDYSQMANHIACCIREGHGKDPQDEWGVHALSEFLSEEYVIEVLVKSSAPHWNSRAAATKLVKNRTSEELWAIALRGDPYNFLLFPKAYELLTIALSGEIKEAEPSSIEKHHPDGKKALDELWTGLQKWVAISWLHHDLPQLATQIERLVVILTDTDSTFLNLNPWVTWLKNNFDFSEATEEDELTGLNVIIYLLRLFSDYQMGILTRNLNVPIDKRKTINFKSEFVISRLLITSGKKHYAGLTRYQEGTRIVGDKLDIKGLQMKKTTVSKISGKACQKTVEQRILRAPEVDRIGVIQDIIDLEKLVYDSINSGSTEFAKPESLGRISGYVDMYAQPSVRGSIAYNAISELPIREAEKIHLFPIKVGTRVELITNEMMKYSEDSEEYNSLKILLETFFGIEAPDGLTKNGLNWFAVPKESKTYPKWLTPLIDIESTLSANTDIMNPILESINIKVLKTTDSDAYSNIVRF